MKIKTTFSWLRRIEVFVALSFEKLKIFIFIFFDFWSSLSNDTKFIRFFQMSQNLKNLLQQWLKNRTVVSLQEEYNGSL